MARKETITKADILQAAFDMAREEGVELVTARRLAVKAGCSTQPIFRVYKNMEELLEEVFLKAVDFFEEFYAGFAKEYETPFVNLGVAYIQFAQEDGNLFQMLFLKQKRYGKSLYDLINGKTGAVGTEINKAAAQGCQDPGNLFMKMWIFIHGAACMSLTGDYDLTMTDTVKLLKESYEAYLG